ncbi:MAG: DUF1566 domain-containing protein [Ectothiorhodospiraceae bacterium]|nr:DUF1566 domain-containing protein [Ectothiorhodospiraceae bacterium]
MIERTGRFGGLLILLFVLSACGADVNIDESGGDTSPATFVLEGTVTDDPVSEAAVFIYDAVGNLVGQTGTDANGHFSWPDLPHGDYRVVTNGGWVRGQPFVGSMTARCSGSPCHVTPLTTLADAYAERNGLSYEDALAAVLAAFGLPMDPFAAELDGASLVDLEPVRNTIADGGIEAWLDVLLDLIGQGADLPPEYVGIPIPDPTPDPTPDPDPTPGTVATPTLTPAGGVFGGPVEIALATATAGASIRYTIDGTDPGATSTLYGAPFLINPKAGPVQVRARAFRDGLTDSAVGQALFVPGYGIAGVVTGYTGSGLVLRNGDETLDVAADGGEPVPFSFATLLVGDTDYSVTVETQPAGLTCVVSGGSGTIQDADVANVVVTCVVPGTPGAPGFSIGGTVSGLADGNAVVLANGMEERTVSTDGEFAFILPVADGGAYAVTVALQPGDPDQTCTVADGSGIVDGADVTDVTVTCATDAYSIGGDVSGLAGTLVLTNNGSDALSIDADGAFVFDTPVADGSGYEVAVDAQPAGQTCQVSNGIGIVTGADVTDVAVSCFTDVDLTATSAKPGDAAVVLAWNDEDYDGATFLLCRAREDIVAFDDCATLEGGLLTVVSGGSHIADGLVGGAGYWFRLGVLHGEGQRTLSDVVYAVPAVGLNDTGITRCGNHVDDADASNDLDCDAFGVTATSEGEYEMDDDPIFVPAGQDALYGRDAHDGLEKAGGGRAGFDFTKIAGDGSDLPVSATEWDCVRDNVTGRVWEVKTDDDGLRDRGHRYDWYDADATTNGGAAGSVGTDTCGGTLSAYGNQCNTQNYVDAVNDGGLCGADDWRLPSRSELLSIADLGIWRGIDVNYFPDMNVDGSLDYWSSSPDVSDSGYAWLLKRGYGWEEATREPKTSDFRVRLVRGP